MSHPLDHEPYESDKLYGGKYDTSRNWDDKCRVCGCNIVLCNAKAEVTGPYCDGCMGWPVCGCKRKHTGDCQPAPEGCSCSGPHYRHSGPC